MPIPPELASACADIALAGDSDTIQGRQARYVAAPASTEEASALLRAAAALGLTVVPRGAGRLQHWGNPPDSCDLIVDTRRLDRIVEHATDDFTVTVQAGVRLRDLEQEVEARPPDAGAVPAPPGLRRHRRRPDRDQRGRLAPLPLRHAARPAHRHHRGPRRWHDRPQRRRRQCRRTGPGHAVRRLLRQPRIDHRGHLPAGAAAAGLGWGIDQMRRSRTRGSAGRDRVRPRDGAVRNRCDLAVGG